MDDKDAKQNTYFERTALLIRDQRIQEGRKVPKALKTIQEPMLFNGRVDYIENEILDIDVIINGSFHGVLKTNGNITINGLVEGDLYSNNIVINRGGRVEGCLFKMGTDVISSMIIEGELIGDVFGHKISVKNSGLINGSVKAEAVICSGYGSEIMNGLLEVSTFVKVLNGGIIKGEIVLDSAIMKT